MLFSRILFLAMQQTHPRNFIELLEVFRICVTTKVMSTQRIVNWADTIIQQDATPDYFVVELAMCGSRNINDMISLLNNYIGENKPSIAGRVTLGFLFQEYTAGKIDLYRIVRTIDWLAQNVDFTEEECKFMHWVDDAYLMAVEGVYSSVTEIMDSVLRFLTCYQAFQLGNMPEWNEINASVPEKVQMFYNQSKIS